MNPKIDAVDSEILDALSDDYESVEQIHLSLARHDVGQEEIISRLERLHSQGYVKLMDEKSFDRAEILREISETKDRKFWFCLTTKGDEERA